MCCLSGLQGVYLQPTGRYCFLHNKYICIYSLVFFNVEQYYKSIMLQVEFHWLWLGVVSTAQQIVVLLHILLYTGVWSKPVLILKSYSMTGEILKSMGESEICCHEACNSPECVYYIFLLEHFAYRRNYIQGMMLSQKEKKEFIIYYIAPPSIYRELYVYIINSVLSLKELTL